jgi:glycosyltransferase involved in cell wall biosynthesis
MPTPVPTRVRRTNGQTKIGFVAPCLLEGGAERWQRHLVKALTDVPPPGAPVTWVGCCVLDSSVTNSAMLAATSSIMPLTYGESALAALANQADILISWAVYPFSTFLPSLSSPPGLIFACHMQDDWGTTAPVWLANADRFVATSPAAAAKVPSTFTGLLSTILNGVDPAIATPALSKAQMRNYWGVPANDQVAGFIGRLANEKDPLAMVRLANSLSAGMSAVVVGDGPLASALDGAIVTQNLTGKLYRVGVFDDAASAINGFDALIVPSLYESFGYSIAQGLYAGVPVISTPVGCATYQTGLTRSIPISAGGNAIVGAFVADLNDPDGTGGRVATAKSYAQSALTLSRFGSQWASLIDGMFAPGNGVGD